MKKIVYIVLMIVLLMMFGEILTADLLDVYKKGEIKLIADPEFGKNVDWKTLFYDYNKTASLNDKEIGLIKSLGISENGDIFIANYSQFNVFKFDSNGNFIKKMAEEGRKTGPNSPINRRPDSASILDNKYLVISEYQGRIGLYDLEGNLVKLMKMDYGVKDCIALKENKIAVLGSVVVSNRRMKRLVAIKDTRTEKENHLVSVIEDMSKTSISVQKDNCIIGFSGPFKGVHTFIRRTGRGNLLVGHSDSPKITVFSPGGEVVKSFDISAQPIKITEKVTQEYLDGIKKSITKLELPESVMEEVLSKPGFIPPVTPHYYQLMLDSEDNMLVFIYTDDEKEHVFQVYSPDGTYVCDTVVNPGNYLVRLNPGLKSMAFFNGDLYGIFQLKNENENPLRLIRVKLSNQ